MNDVYLALGSNVEPRKNVARALAELRQRYPLLRVSPFYETLPWGFTPQASFLNCVVHVVTREEPRATLRWGQQLERLLARRHIVRNGPRTIDIDLLLHGATHATTPALTIPHPGLSERDFMLLPLLELDRSVRDPRTGAPLAAGRHQLRYRCIVGPWRE
jgi:2-amino-4-hydroxy-6-hydroxymethyldihydropteridine diphosphokinase